MSEVEAKILDVTGGRLAKEGYETNGFGIEYFKDEIFSEAHNILMELLANPAQGYDYTWTVEFVNDHEATEHPDVFQAWTNAGGESESLQTVAKSPDLCKWGVGFGGKKNGERAAKLALAASIALDSEQTPRIVNDYPSFGMFLDNVAASVAGGGAAACGGGKGAKGGSKGGKAGGKGSKGARSSPYGDAGYGGDDFEGGDDGELVGQLVALLGKGGGGKGKLGKVAALLAELEGGWEEEEAGGGWGGAAASKKGKAGGKAAGGGAAAGKGKGASKGAAGKGPNLKNYPAETKVWVGNLPQSATNESLQEHFALTGGTVLGAVVMKNGTGAVAYESAEEAAQAIQVMNMSDMDGQAIEVDVWTSK